MLIILNCSVLRQSSEMLGLEETDMGGFKIFVQFFKFFSPIGESRFLRNGTSNEPEISL